MFGRLDWLTWNNENVDLSLNAIRHCVQFVRNRDRVVANRQPFFLTLCSTSYHCRDSRHKYSCRLPMCAQFCSTTKICFFFLFANATPAQLIAVYHYSLCFILREKVKWNIKQTEMAFLSIPFSDVVAFCKVRLVVAVNALLQFVDDRFLSKYEICNMFVLAPAYTAYAVHTSTPKSIDRLFWFRSNALPSFASFPFRFHWFFTFLLVQFFFSFFSFVGLFEYSKDVFVSRPFRANAAKEPISNRLTVRRRK